MKHLAATLSLFAVLCLLAPAAALAGEALPQLKGLWVVETVDGSPLPDGASMSMDFVDDAKLVATAVTPDGKKMTEEMKYAATKDGKLTLYPDPDTDPDGETASWKIDKGKLIITSAENETLVFKRP